MDYADALEEIRATLRRLCTGPVGLDVESAYGGDMACPDRLEALSRRLVEGLPGMDPGARAEASEGAAALAALAAKVRGGLLKPPAEELCLRFGDGKLDARTVLYMTGWEADQMFDECARLTGRAFNAAY